MLRNITELLAEQRLENVLKSQNCCKCDRCKEDILALALCNLPAHYVSSEAGELYARAKALSSKYDFDILRELAIAIKMVSEHPHHPPVTEDEPSVDQ